ncbi:DUF2945 domain-containing protein [Croceicoccus sp. F390]|uniref:DUF2945 domain-containing protein n=1 Tax=Croceicoccus esteveae TaxID=3075597 RepID=A0ABU2ZFQ6_9SPHN|nr:DUF2945 domain-containing protein [Croceicoccus sp. F390]MDT0574908.1 DUF2945 domain-containing protein [Croceicoccus sp. F390]
MADTKKFGKNQHVKWNWGSGTAKGQVQERFERDVERTIKGTKVKKHGSEDNPAYLIKQEDGDEVLKLGSELETDS